MTGWSTATLGELASKARYSCVGGPFGSELTTRDYVDDGVPVIRGSNLGADGFIDDGFVYVSEPKADSLQGNLAFPGDVVFTQRGTIGQVALIPMSARHSRYVLSQSQMKVSLDLARVEGRYLVEWFRSPDARRHLAQHTLATGVPHINLGILKRVPVPLRSLGEQRRIADMLDKADAIRRKRKQAIALTDDLLRSVFLDMFGDPDTNPKGWPVAVVDDLCSHIVDCPHSTPKYGGKGRLHPCVRTSDLQDGFFDWSTTKHVDATEYNERITRLAPIPGDVFYTREGERYGIAAILPDNVFACLGQRMMLLRANPAVATAEFLWALMNSSAIYQRAQAEAGGSTSPHVNVGSVRRFRGMRPPLELQRHYSRIYATTTLARVRNQAAIRECERLFFSLSAQAFAGASAMQC